MQIEIHLAGAKSCSTSFYVSAPKSRIIIVQWHSKRHEWVFMMFLYPPKKRFSSLPCMRGHNMCHSYVLARKKRWSCELVAKLFCRLPRNSIWWTNSFASHKIFLEKVVIESQKNALELCSCINWAPKSQITDFRCKLKLTSLVQNRVPRHFTVLLRNRA